MKQQWGSTEDAGAQCELDTQIGPSRTANQCWLIPVVTIRTANWKFLRHKPGCLAGGEQQRLAQGRALLRKPAREILFLALAVNLVI